MTVKSLKIGKCNSLKRPLSRQPKRSQKPRSFLQHSVQTSKHLENLIISLQSDAPQNSENSIVPQNLVEVFMGPGRPENPTQTNVFASGIFYVWV